MFLDAPLIGHGESSPGKGPWQITNLSPELSCQNWRINEEPQLPLDANVTLY